MALDIDAVISRDGTRIGFVRSGSGPPLVLVHGTTADHVRWGPILPALEEHFTVYAVDRRGRGLSEDAPDYALQREAEDIARVVDSISEPADVFGHSYGALASLEAAPLSRNLRRLVLYEPPIPTPLLPDPTDLSTRLEELLAAGKDEDALVRFLHEGAGIPDEQVEAMRAAPVWPARVDAAHTIPREYGMTGYEFSPERFASLDVPVLFLLGGDSPAFYTAATELACSALPNARIEVMPGQQHVAITIAPDLIARLVVDFLTEP
ncbi:MAG: alpha/beta hydrolase [Dehalococcoidia bacterium]